VKSSVMIDTYGSDDAGAVRADQAGLVLGLEDVGDADHVYGVYIRSGSTRRR
jgi:hypothetical protein